MSPVEMCAIAESSARRLACVPLPAPGAPRNTARARTWVPIGLAAAPPPAGGAPGLLHEALVVAHHQHGVELLDQIERDADDDQDRGAAHEVDQHLVGGAREPAADERREH